MTASDKTRPGDVALEIMGFKSFGFSGGRIDFFGVITSMDYERKPQNDDERRFDINQRESGDTAFDAPRCDLIIDANARLRQIPEVYVGSDGHERLIRDFVAAWHRVMMLDRFDVPEQRAAAVFVDCFG